MSGPGQALRRLFSLLLLFPLAISCRTGGVGPSVSTAAGASAITALAVGSAVYERSQGRCIAICTNGTACNGKTGLCEVLPCRGRCDDDQHCQVTFSESKCVAGAAGVTAQAKSDQGGGPSIVPVAPPDTNSAAPTIVPTAERQPPKGK